ncbi:LruC domain-containing protein [Flammeovirga sp. EKP202]|uniref:LruC domain-containing protein n=1 Tax=Flammeovirga sp. EKP202 TaxID=2770592 RepID=UPI00165FB376|nr:LruC domain-containing protein [Flammeovirga sp. EKP202]MBD0402504.1 LruC domain-containing protein [Flammeovirga sp. EKP202]
MKKLLFLILSFTFLCVSCQKENETTQNVPSAEEGFESIQVDPSFDYSTNANFLFSVEQEYTDSNLPIEIYTSNSFEEGELISEVAIKGSESFTSTYNLNKGLKKVYIKVNKVGVPQFYEFDVQPGLNRLVVNESSIYDNTIENEANSSARMNYSGSLYDTYGGWNAQGLPNYLTDPDTVPQALLDDIDASLPERRPVPTYNPDYLVDVNYDSRVTDSCDIWITFVHEGAGWRNSLAYYTYTTGSPPQTTDDIDSIKVVFPNVSFLYSGGQLETGHKIHLGTFAPNTSIGWVLIPNGWQSSSSQAFYRNDVKFSNYQLNTVSAEGFRQHMVALKDVDRELILLGFEDITRPSGDNDFNDCIFYLTSNPFNAIDTGDIGDISEAEDSDGDGAYDHEEEYPDDPERAYNVYINNRTNYSTYGFEDMWPEKGDYDFNDVVIGVNYKKVVNTNYYIKDIVMQSELYAIGGFYHNGFGIAFPFNASTVNSISGQILDKGVVNVGSNGTEVGNTKATVIFFEDAYSLMSSSDVLVNVKQSGNYVTPHQFTITMDMNIGQVHNTAFTNFPNAFIFVDQDRGREVHMPNQPPTQLANSDFFETYDDVTDPDASIYYKTSANHPWAINVVAEKFYYPYEGVEVSNAYNHFKNWAESSGNNYSDWFKSKSGYRNSEKIYQRP